MTTDSNAARVLAGRSWEGTSPADRQARTAPGLAVINTRLRALVDPTGLLPEAEVAAGVRKLRAARLAAARAEALAKANGPDDAA